MATVAAVLLASRIAFSLGSSPLPDEAYYWLWGRHLDLSYVDHPPLQAWMQRLFFELFGHSRAALRAPTVLTTAVIMVCFSWLLRHHAGRAGTNIGGGIFVVVTGVFSSLVFFLFTTMAFPDHLMLALLGVATVCAVQVLETVEETAEPALASLYGAGAALGLAMLTKFNAGLFAVGLVIMVLWHAPYRPLLRSPHFYAALILAAAIFAPVVWWNWSHASGSFRCNLHDRLAFDPKRSLSRGLTFVAACVFTLSPYLAVSAFQMFRREKASVWSRIAVASFAVSGLFWLAMSGFTFVLYYWNIVAYLAALPLLVLGLRRPLWLMAHGMYGGILAALFAANYAVLPLAAQFGIKDSETAVTYGWPEVSDKAKDWQAKLGADFLAASDYRHGAILAWWTGDINVEVFSTRHSQFDLWLDQGLRARQDAILVTDDWHPLTENIRSVFEKVDLLETVPLLSRGRQFGEYRLWHATVYKSAANQ